MRLIALLVIRSSQLFDTTRLADLLMARPKVVGRLKLKR